MKSPNETRAARWDKVLDQISGAIDTALGEVEAQERTLVEHEKTAPAAVPKLEDLPKADGHHERIERIARRVAEAGDLIDKEIEAVEAMRRRLRQLHERLRSKPGARSSPES